MQTFLATFREAGFCKLVKGCYIHCKYVWFFFIATCHFEITLIHQTDDSHRLFLNLNICSCVFSAVMFALTIIVSLQQLLDDEDNDSNDNDDNGVLIDFYVLSFSQSYRSASCNMQMLRQPCHSPTAPIFIFHLDTNAEKRYILCAIYIPLNIILQERK